MQNDLLQAQAFTETTWGTSGTPTVKLADVDSFSIDPNAVVDFPTPSWGSLSPSDEAILLAHNGAGKFEQKGVYEDICYWLDNVLGQATPSGAGPYVRAYTGPGTSVPTPRVMSLYWGQSGAGNGFRVTGSLLQALTIKANSKGYTTVQGEFVGKVAEAQALASLSDRTVNKILGRHWSVYVDAWGGTIGTTAIASSAYAFELKITAPRNLLTYLGAATAGDYSFERYSYDLKLRLEFNATTTTYLTEILSQSSAHQRQIRLQADDTANRQLRLDIGATGAKAPSLWQSEGGRAVWEYMARGVYNSTLGAAFKASATNSVSALA